MDVAEELNVPSNSGNTHISPDVTPKDVNMDKTSIDNVSTDKLLPNIEMPADKERSKRFLKEILSQELKIEVSDGRLLVGRFMCTDRDRNVILNACSEHAWLPSIPQIRRNDPNKMEHELRVIGLVVVPGKHIKRMWLGKVIDSITNEQDLAHTRVARNRYCKNAGINPEDCLTQIHCTEQEMHEIERQIYGRELPPVAHARIDYDDVTFLPNEYVADRLVDESSSNQGDYYENQNNLKTKPRFDYSIEHTLSSQSISSQNLMACSSEYAAMVKAQTSNPQFYEQTVQESKLDFQSALATNETNATKLNQSNVPKIFKFGDDSNVSSSKAMDTSVKGDEKPNLLKNVDLSQLCGEDIRKLELIAKAAKKAESSPKLETIRNYLCTDKYKQFQLKDETLLKDKNIDSTLIKESDSSKLNKIDENNQKLEENKNSDKNITNVHLTSSSSSQKNKSKAKSKLKNKNKTTSISSANENTVKSLEDMYSIDADDEGSNLSETEQLSQNLCSSLKLNIDSKGQSLDNKSSSKKLDSQKVSNKNQDKNSKSVVQSKLTPEQEDYLKSLRLSDLKVKLKELINQTKDDSKSELMEDLDDQLKKQLKISPLERPGQSTSNKKRSN